jgi:protein gp37
MGENTAISWCDDTFNPWIGCKKVSPACDGCYAEALMGQTGRYKRVEWGAQGKGVGTRVRTVASTWAKPLKWNREQAAHAHNCRLIGEVAARRFVFCASLADVFDNAVPPEWRRDLFGLIRATPNLTWLLLTKRPGNIVKLAYDAMSCRGKSPVDENFVRMAWPRNAAIGCTIVTQEEADRDVPVLLAAKAALNPAFAFVSMEPLLGPVRLDRIAHGDESDLDCLRGQINFTPQHIAVPPRPAVSKIDWVITGGETDQGGHKARPSHPGWFRSLRDQCAAAGVAYHHKQNGEWAPLAFVDPDGSVRSDDAMIWPDGHVGGGVWTKRGGYGSLQRHVGKARSGRLLDGVTHDARPAVR